MERKGIQPAAKKEYTPCDQLFQHSVVAYDPAGLFLHLYNSIPAVLAGIFLTYLVRNPKTAQDVAW